MIDEKEFDNNPETNKMHIYNNVKVINKIVLDYEEGGFDNVIKTDIEALGNGFYQFMINRISGRDFDIFVDSVEIRASYLQLSYYKKNVENFVTDMYIYQRVCDVLETMYLRVYEQGDKMSKMLMYKFIRQEIESVLDIEIEPGIDKFVKVCFMYDLLKSTEDMLSHVDIVNDDLTTITKNKITTLLKTIEERCSEGARTIHLKRICNEVDNIMDNDIRRMIKEVATSITSYGLNACRGGNKDDKYRIRK